MITFIKQQVHLLEELCLCVLGAEQHGAGPRRTGGHGQDERLGSNDHLLLSFGDSADELTVVLISGDWVRRPKAITV